MSDYCWTTTTTTTNAEWYVPNDNPYSINGYTVHRSQPGLSYGEWLFDCKFETYPKKTLNKNVKVL
jgi:hypothetical protein